MWYKVLDARGRTCNGGTAKWNLPKGDRPGRWMKPIANIKMCTRGYHLVAAAQITQWLTADDNLICEAEPRGEYLGPYGGKVCCTSARILRVVGKCSAKMLRLFACDCAERALAHVAEPDSRSIAAIAVARRFANGEVTADQLAAAWDAARAAEEEWQGAHLLEMLEKEENE